MESSHPDQQFATAAEVVRCVLCRYGKYDSSGDPYFYHLHGSSWHADDAAFIFWLDRHKTLLIVTGLVMAVTLICGYWVRCLVRIRKTRTF